jgi:hypothetical protein
MGWKMPRVRGSCRAPLGKRLSVVLESFRAGGGAHCLHLLEGGIGRRWVRVTRGSRWCALSSPPGGSGWVAAGELVGCGGVAHCLHLLRMGWVSGWRVRVTRGRRSRASCFTSLRWRGRWGRECELLGSDGGAHGLHLLAVGGRPTAGPSGLLGGGGVAHFVLLAAVSGRFLRAGNLR